MSFDAASGLLVRLLLLAWAFLPASATTRAADDPGWEALTQLARSTYAPAVAAGEAGPALFRSLYWLRMATTLNDLSPAAALRSAYERSDRPASPVPSSEPTNRAPVPAPYEAQLLADWHIACVYGLFTSENLVRLRAGNPPIATDGPYMGQTIQTHRISLASRYGSPADFALGPENEPLPGDAVPSAGRSTVIIPAAPQSWPVRPPAPRANPLPATNRAGRPGSPTGRDMPMAAWQKPSEPTLVPSPFTPKEPARVQLQDLPFNGLLPMEGRVKLGIASVTSSEISVSIVGKSQVSVRYPNGTVMSNPTVENYKVPKINPVRLPGVSSDAYLIKDDRGERSGIETRYYYIDTSVDNGMTFRIAKVMGSL